jgi:hypothetical protein
MADEQKTIDNPTTGQEPDANPKNESAVSISVYSPETADVDETKALKSEGLSRVSRFYLEHLNVETINKDGTEKQSIRLTWSYEPHKAWTHEFSIVDKISDGQYEYSIALGDDACEKLLVFNRKAYLCIFGSGNKGVFETGIDEA